MPTSTIIQQSPVAPETTFRGVVAHSQFAAERRLKNRYPMDLSVRFRSHSQSAVFSGSGRTVNLSSGGIFVVSEDVVPEVEISVNARVEMSITWPVLLDGSIQLQLLAVGRIVRWGPASFAATFERHAFRTMKNSSVPLVNAWSPKEVPAL